MDATAHGPIGKGACCDQTPADMIGSGRMRADTGAVSVMRTPSALSKLRVAGGQGTRFSRRKREVGRHLRPPSHVSPAPWSTYTSPPSSPPLLALRRLSRLPPASRRTHLLPCPTLPRPVPTGSPSPPPLPPPGRRRRPERPSRKAPSALSRAATPVGSAGRYVDARRVERRAVEELDAHRCLFFAFFPPLCHIISRQPEMRRAAQRAWRVPDLRQASSAMPWFRCEATRLDEGECPTRLLPAAKSSVLTPHRRRPSGEQ